MWILKQDKQAALNAEHIALLRVCPARPGRHYIEAVMVTGQIVVLQTFDTVDEAEEKLNDLAVGLSLDQSHRRVDVNLPSDI